MDDPSRQPRESDRAPIRQRIERAVADGRIGDADGKIRLRNVAAAQSMGELDLVARDLEQVERALPGTPTPAATADSGAGRSRSSVWVAAVLAVLVGVAGIGVAGVLVFRDGGSSGPSVALGNPQPIRTDPTGSEPSASPSGGAPSGPAYSLTAAGLHAFLAAYRERFGTTRAVEATFYGDYVVVQVPIGGGHRHSGWVYRTAGGFTDFGGQAANFPGSAAFDLARLDVAALLQNVSRAKRVLRVEKANQVYVHLDYRPQFDPAPNVNIYLTNKFNESGYLATRLDGTVERSYPYANGG